jgi:acyl-CoA thioester hydrolase
MSNPPSRFTSDGIHTAVIRVYYEDTDTGGIVYYANYLKFAERARTEVLRDLGITQRALMESDGLAFAVRRCEVDYLMPARLDDELEVHTTLRALGKASLDLDQAIYRRDPGGGESRELARLVVRLAVINREGRPTRLPSKIADSLRSLAVKPGGPAPVQPSTPTLADVSAVANKKRA